MPKKKPDAGKLRPDVAETAYRTVQEALGERPKTKPPQEQTDEPEPKLERSQPKAAKPLTRNRREPSDD